MAKGTTVNISIPNAQEIVDKYGLDAGGKTQHFFINTLKTVSDPYVPMGDGHLKNQSFIVDDGTTIHYVMPYARLHWFGEIMVDPETGYAGTFMGDGIGWRSRAGVKKIPASQSSQRSALGLPLYFNYKGGPMRGSMWVFRAYADNREEILKSVEKFIVRGG